MRLLKFSLLVTIMLISFSCTTEFGSACMGGVGDVERRTVELEMLNRIDLAMSGELIINEGLQNIEIEAPSDIIDKILNDSQVSNEEWTIEFNGCYDGPEIKVWATLPQFLALSITGSGDVRTLDTLKNVGILNLAIDGSGDMDIVMKDALTLDAQIKGSGNIAVKSRDASLHTFNIQGSGDITSYSGNIINVRSSIEGSGNITLLGKADTQLVHIEGQGNFFGFDLCSESCDIIVEGSGNCEVKVENRLGIRLEGSGNICYLGQPILNTTIEGTGNVSSCN